MTGTLDVVVLAGGAARRMGHDKATLVLDGQRLVDHVASRMATVADHVIVASGPRSLGRDDEVADAPDVDGPLAGVLAALRVSSARMLAIVPVDAPATDPALLVRLADWCAGQGRAAAVAVTGERVQALHAVVAVAARDAVEARVTSGERSPRGLLAWLDAARMDVDGWSDLDPVATFADDWDRPEDLPPGVGV